MYSNVYIADEQLLIDKIINLISEVELIVNVIPKKKEDDSPPLKMRKLDPGGQVLSDDWVRLDACRVLTMSAREIIVQNKKLDDLVINFAKSF